MKWLKSTTQKSWVASCKGKQVIIPPCETPDNKWLKAEEDEYAEIAAIPVIASLVKAGGIMVLNEEPAELRNSVPALQITNTQLEAENATLRARVNELEGQLKDANNIDIEAIKAAAVEAKQAEYDALKTEAEQALADKDREIESRDKIIEKLEKRIKKLGGDETDGE